MWFLPQPVAPGATPSLDQSLAYIWDEATRESYPVPAVGKGGIRGFLYDRTKFLVNFRDGRVKAFDLETGTVSRLTDLDSVGFIFVATTTQDGRTIAFIANPDGTAERGERTRAFLWRDGNVVKLTKIDAVAARHGGLAWQWLSAGGEVLCFGTVDHGVFLYTLGTGVLLEVVDARAVSDSQFPAVSPDGLKLAWIGGRPRQTFFIMDVATMSTPAGTAYRPVGPPRAPAELDFANVAPEFVAQGPVGRTLYVAILRTDLGEYRLIRYDYEDSRVALLTTLNLLGRAESGAASYPTRLAPEGQGR